MKKGIVLRLSVILSLISVVATPYYEDSALAKETTNLRHEKLITKIDIEGNKTISGSTILAKVKSRVGDRFSQSVISEDIKRIYAIGYFSDVKIDLKDYDNGLKVTFIVKEKSIISNILFEGNKKFTEKKLLETIKSKKNNFLNRKELKDDLNKIESLYKQKGYGFVKIESEVVTDQESGTSIIYILVDEGKKIRIKKFYIEGNNNFSNKKIKKLIKTKTDTWFSSGFFNEDTFKDDIERIKYFYRDKGYLDVAVDYDVQYDKKRKDMYITIDINEGIQYLVGEITIEGATVFPEKEITKKLEMLPEQIFNKSGLRKDVLNIQSFYFERGYISCEVQADTHFDIAHQRMDINYKIIENKVAYINRIDIRGNSITKDIVIRRELRIHPGDKFNGAKLDRSKQRLKNLGYFEEISYEIEDSDRPDKKNLILNVKETKTGEFSFGGGFSSIDKLIGFIDIKQRNFDISNWKTFTGDGQQLELRAEIGNIKKDFELSFTEPWIFDKPLLFGFDIFNLNRNREQNVGYGFDEQRVGGDIRLGKEYGEYKRVDTMFKLESVDISDIPANATNDLRKEEGDNLVASIMQKFTYDNRDNIFSPSRGMLFTLSGEIAAIDKDYYKLYSDMTMYFKQFNKLILSARVRAGIADVLSGNDAVPIFERFFAGGANTIRGFEEREVGPKDGVTIDPIGGESILLLNLEYAYPVADFIKLAFFFDVGNVWADINQFGQGHYRAGVGPGVRIKTPFGPVKLDYGFPINTESGEEDNPRFHFNISRGF